MEDNGIDYQRILAYLRLFEDEPAKDSELDYTQLLNERWNRFLTTHDRAISKVILRSNDDELDSLLRVKGERANIKERIVCLVDLKAQTKPKVVAELAKAAYEHQLTPSQDGLYFRLLERESKMSTAIGDGVAIPHVHCPSSELFRRQSLLVAVSPLGVDFDAPDKRKVRLFFMPCASDAYTHIRLLARIAKFLHNVKLKAELLNAHDEKTALALIEKNLV